MVKKGFIDEKGLENIKKHKYVSGVYTPLDNLLGYWWEIFVLVIPQSVAPNMVTLFALILTIFNAVLFMYQDTTFTKLLPV
jgi:hypothetical protein